MNIPPQALPLPLPHNQQPQPRGRGQCWGHWGPSSKPALWLRRKVTVFLLARDRPPVHRPTWTEGRSRAARVWPGGSGGLSECEPQVGRELSRGSRGPSFLASTLGVGTQAHSPLEAWQSDLATATAPGTLEVPHAVISTQATSRSPFRPVGEGRGRTSQPSLFSLPLCTGTETAPSSPRGKGWGAGAQP